MPAPELELQESEGGGLALDMMAHWRYMIDRLVAPVTGVCALMSTAIPERVDEGGRPYAVDAEDTNYALLKMQGGAVGMITNSWATRPRRDDTMVVQIDGTQGSAVAGRFRCFTQSAAETPEAFIKAARPGGVDLMAHWKEVPDPPGTKILSASAGKRSCGTSARMRRICRRWSRARRRCSSPTLRIAASPSSAGWSCRN